MIAEEHFDLAADLRLVGRTVNTRAAHLLSIGELVRDWWDSSILMLFGEARTHTNTHTEAQRGVVDISSNERRQRHGHERVDYPPLSSDYGRARTLL